MPKDAPWPPNMKSKYGFSKFLMSDGHYIDENSDKDLMDPYPVGKNLAANKMFSVFYRYSVDSYRDGTAAGLAAHQRFIAYLSTSWTSMVTSGYSNSYNTRVGKLGKLTTFSVLWCNYLP